MTSVNDIALNTQIWTEWKCLSLLDRQKKWNTHTNVNLKTKEYIKHYVENPQDLIAAFECNYGMVQYLPLSFINEVKQKYSYINLNSLNTYTPTMFYNYYYSHYLQMLQSNYYPYDSMGLQTNQYAPIYNVSDHKQIMYDHVDKNNAKITNKSSNKTILVQQTDTDKYKSKPDVKECGNDIDTNKCKKKHQNMDNNEKSNSEKVYTVAIDTRAKQHQPPLKKQKMSNNTYKLDQLASLINDESESESNDDIDMENECETMINEKHSHLNIERKSVYDWNYYAIIFWLNRIKDGKFKTFKYINLKKHIRIGALRGNQLGHLNDVTLRMIGIDNDGDIELILNMISELIIKDEFNNIVANTLLTDMVPYIYCDPISFELMDEPVLMQPHGYIYEKKWIVEYVRKYNKDPLTHKPVQMSQLIVDHCLKKKIACWKHNNFATIYR